MKLIRLPQRPVGGPFFTVPYHYLGRRDEWQKYLPRY
jgi:hypothetical protein